LTHIKGDNLPAGYEGLEFAREFSVTRNPLLPWYIGLVIIILADGYLLAFRTDEGAAEFAQQSAMVVIPVVALALMFLMFRSQK
jgi:hypothetical protein